MKRGKDGGEKVMGPMFPRLHVNDAEKGGPRAPPRNKMALYEQLSIPSQRFNHVGLNRNNSVPPSSSIQVSSADRTNCFPLHLPLSKPTYLPEKLSGLVSERSNVSSMFARHRQYNKSRGEDDFSVPVFAHSQEAQEKNPANPNRVYNHFRKELAEPENIGGEESREVDKYYRENGNGESPVEVANASDSPTGNTERSDNVSEASMLDSISVIDVSPDDVVGAIGQKHFWKARRAIVNQQRVFAVQVFELHRLIKVQKLMASSPHLLLEDMPTTPSKPSSKSLPAALPENNKKLLPPAMKHGEDHPHKPTHPVEYSAENAVMRAPAPTSKNSQPGSVTVSSSCPWGPPQHQDQSSGQRQWLIPVMSPTEGLVYKPYSGPGFNGTGFCGPYDPNPMMMGNFRSQVYGVPAHQGMGFVPGIPHTGHSYFPTYGMPVMSGAVSGTGSGSVSALQKSQSGPFPTEESDRSVSVQRATPITGRFQRPKGSDIQVSTGSSPANNRTEPAQACSMQNRFSSNEMRVTETGSFNGGKEFGSGDGKDELQLFPMAPATAEPDRLTRVIRAVPHNARSASASVARIFRSIQEERKHNGSV